MPLTFEPTREAALLALQSFVPKAGRDYTAKRNFDVADHPHVSKLSPYIRHRILTEQEVLETVLGRYSAETAEKFIQEVFWRTYWKGWLEMRPGVWSHYKADLNAVFHRVQTERRLLQDWEAACTGTTGISAFDHWAQELATTGYLHNHARMWFASIWIFTLQLPWQLGADFFLRHLLDGDPASNTLGWRWVAGLQTQGKTYLARANNIAKYTENRFDALPQLTGEAIPLPWVDPGPAVEIPRDPLWEPTAPSVTLLHEDDLSAAWLRKTGMQPLDTAGMVATKARSPNIVNPLVKDFAKRAVENAVSLHGGHGPVTDDIAALVQWAKNRNAAQLVTNYAPVGPTAAHLDQLEQHLAPLNIRVVRLIRPYDARAWPHATRGFFRFKKAIPALIAAL